ncbi:adenylate kinase [Buchnera aphidicola (Cinara tujafilina)]|uniref:Adenylate kinase n=1 Tax=Buchnera aphidicola (Cinara tujafilina) TaxID=261317 RepID=F7WZL7_9GAMM|nr:nucleoside monophosphate kinase [Buchnera aphidicola]AEH39884.1 adenylate kinase [Buchnera aphidicola (Cinara tujafilina)]
MIKIVMLGAPGSGKGTQMQLLSNYYRIPPISVGDILRKKININQKFKKNIKNYINNGKLVNDDIIIELIKKRIEKKDCKSGFILDGFPRTIKQAEILKNNLFTINYILHLKLSEKKIFERISGRLVHIPSGRCYHEKFNPPQKKNRDNITGEKLSIRKDDNINIIKIRLYEYQKYINPLLIWFNKNMNQKNIKFFEIQTNDSIKNIHKKILSLLK